MAYYDALIAHWPTLTPGTTAAKLAQLNGQTVAGAAVPAFLDVNAIINAILPADLLSLSAIQLQQMQFVLQGRGTVNASAGTAVRNVFSSIFSGKATTLAALTALITPYDTPSVPWWRFNGYPGPLDANDLVAAGGLT